MSLGQRLKASPLLTEYEIRQKEAEYDTKHINDNSSDMIQECNEESKFVENGDDNRNDFATDESNESSIN